jgi:hypothetical protein
MIGIYRTITIIWKVVEIRKNGKIEPRKRDTYIALAASFILMAVLSIGRGMM